MTTLFYAKQQQAIQSPAKNPGFINCARKEESAFNDSILMTSNVSLCSRKAKIYPESWVPREICFSFKCTHTSDWNCSPVKSSPTKMTDFSLNNDPRWGQSFQIYAPYDSFTSQSDQFLRQLSYLQLHYFVALNLIRNS